MANSHPFVFETVQLSEEEKMAKIFCQQANAYFDGIDGEIFAIPSLRKGREMDLVVWMHFDRFYPTLNTGYIENPELNTEKEYKRRSPKSIWFNSALVILELKKHNTEDSISIQNDKLYLKYEEEYKNASEQSFQQVFQLKSFLAEKLNLPKNKIPIISNFIWLYRCMDKPTQSDELENVIYGDLVFKEFLEQICRLNAPVSYDEGRNISYNACKKDVLAPLENYFMEMRKEKANGLGVISRNKLEIIIKKNIDLESNKKIDEIGSKLTLVKGKPGTGKTIHLVHIAYHLREDEHKPIILTYNRALVQDLNRMLYYSGYDKVINIRTIHSFFYSILLANNLIDPSELDINDYEQKLVELNELMDGETGRDLRQVFKIGFDTVCIDEAQDCTQLEKELIGKIFEPESIVLSIGNRQIVRNHEIDWTQNIPRENINIIKLRKSHRNKKDLVDFFNSFSILHFGLQPWELKENRNLTGGQLHIIQNNLYTKEYHDQLVKELIADGNSMYDLLFLMPSKAKERNFTEELSHLLDSWNYKSFNNTIAENKEKPFPVNEHRILNYQSCRGLEAWIVICWNLDTTIRNIKDHFDDTDEEDTNALINHLNNWLLMIFTRAIDTLVLIFEDMESEEAKMLLDIIDNNDYEHMVRVIT